MPQCRDECDLDGPRCQLGSVVPSQRGNSPGTERMPRHVRVIQLPPVQVADARFTPLLDAAGRPLTDAFRRARAEALCTAYDAARPDVVLLETWPFGRRALAFELEPLLACIAASTPRPRVVASVRDLLQVRADPARDAAVWRVAREFARDFDAGDEAISFETIRDAGLDGNFLGKRHTVSRFRKETIGSAVPEASLGVRMREGSPGDLIRRAHEEARRILSRPKTPLVTREEAAKMDRCLRERTGHS